VRCRLDSEDYHISEILFDLLINDFILLRYISYCELWNTPRLGFKSVDFFKVAENGLDMFLFNYYLKKNVKTYCAI